MAEGAITKNELIKQEALNAFKELENLVDRSIIATDKLTRATIRLNQARLEGKQTLRQERKVIKLQNEEIDNLKKIKLQKEKANALNKKLALSTKKLNTERKKGLSTMQKMQKVAGLVAVAYAAILTAMRGLQKIDKTLKMLDSMNFALQKIAGSAQEAADLFEFVKKTANDFGISIEIAGTRFVKFYAAAKQSGLTMTATQQIFSDMSKAAGVLGLRGEEVQGVFLALEQMLSKGKVTTEELRRQLGERLPGAFGVMAKAAGVGVEELDALLKKGELLSAEVLPRFARIYNETFGIDAVSKVDTLAAASARMGNAWTIMVEDWETGTGALITVFKGFYDIVAETLTLVGELALTMDEMMQKYSSIGGGTGKGRAQDILEKMKKEYGEEEALVNARTLLYNQMIKVQNELQEAQAEGNIFGQSSVTKDKIKGLLISLGGIKSAYNQLGTVWKDMNTDPDKVDPYADRKAEKAAKALDNTISGLVEEQERLVKMYERLAKSAQTEDGQDIYTMLANGARKLLNELKAINNASFDPEGKGLTGVTPTKLGGEPGEYTGKTIAELEELYEEEIDLAIQFTNQMLDLGAMLLARKLEAIQAEMKATEELYDDKIRLAEGDDHQQQLLEEEKRVRMRQLEAEELLIRQKQAKLDKAQAVFNAGLGIASAIIASLTKGPWYTAAVAAIGAAQLATILATPIPQYKHGRKGGPEEMAIVGDGGVPEFIRTSAGIFQTPNKPTMTMLEKGADVYKNKDALRNAIMSDMDRSATRPHESRLIEEAIAKGFKKAKVNNYLKMPKVNVNVDHAMWLAKQKRF